MFRTRVLLILAIGLFTLPALAQYPPVSGDDPAPYVTAIMSGCTIDQKALACTKADQLKERALLNLQNANDSLDAMDKAAGKANDINTAIDVGKNVKDAICGGDALAAAEAFASATDMLVNKAGEGYFEGKAVAFINAADECLEASKKWAELCEECCKQLDIPNFQKQTIVDKNPDRDFDHAIPSDELRRLLEPMTDDERTETRRQAENGTLRACDPNKQAILKLIDADGRLR